MDVQIEYQREAWNAGVLAGFSMALVGWVFIAGGRGYVLIAALALLTVCMMRFAVKYYNSHDDERMEQMQKEYDRMH